MSKPTKQAPKFTIQNCSIVNEAFTPDAQYLAAAQALANAAAANARAIESIADRLAGPVDNRVGIKISGDAMSAAPASGASL